MVDCLTFNFFLLFLHTYPSFLFLNMLSARSNYQGSSKKIGRVQMENFETGIATDCETDDCENYSSLVTVALFEHFDKENEARDMRLRTYLRERHEDAYTVKLDEIIKENQERREKAKQEWREACLNAYEKRMRA